MFLCMYLFLWHIPRKIKLCLWLSKVQILSSSKSNHSLLSGFCFHCLKEFQGPLSDDPPPNVHFPTSKGSSPLLTGKGFAASTPTPKYSALKKPPFLKHNLRILLQNWFKKKKKAYFFPEIPTPCELCLNLKSRNRS